MSKTEGEQPSEQNPPSKELVPGVKLVRTFHNSKPDVRALAFAPGGDVLASGDGEGIVKLWSLESGTSVQITEHRKGIISCLAFGPGPEMLIIGDEHRRGLSIHDYRTGSLISKLPPEGDIFCIAVQEDANLFATGKRTKSGKAEDVTTQIWSADGKLFRVFAGHTHSVFSACWLGEDIVSPGELLATGSVDQTIHIVNIRNWTVRHVLKGHQDTVTGVAYDSTRDILVSASRDKTIRLWRASDGKHLLTLEGHIASIECISFSPDKRLLCSKDFHNTLRLWNCETWECIAIIPDWVSPPARRSVFSKTALAFHPTLPLLATNGWAMDSVEKTELRLIHLLELDFDKLLKKSTGPAVTYTSAKVVLVGESNVGKSYLAHCIATGKAPEPGEITSTHGIKFWPLEPEKTRSDHASLKGKLFREAAPADRQHRRDIVLWDMGGQEEYRLIHQLFLHDTTVAMVLLDPTRGATAFKEVEAWNKALEKQLRGRQATKLLVGAKLDQPSEMVDQQALDRLLKDCGFKGYYETSALNGRGMEGLCEALAEAINWDELGKTNRPELFQAIRDEIERQRNSGVVVVLFDDLAHDLHTNTQSGIYDLIQQEITTASDPEAGKRALDAVCNQFAQQGVIARAKTSGKKQALILRIEEVERYAGSLILAAKRNQKDRGVPALELRTIAQDHFHFPTISQEQRLKRADERAVVECTVQLMLEHGICFEHEGLLIFPSLFASAIPSPEENLLHAISLYYDIAGAIDNIYASLVAWLVLAKEFGKVRLSADRAEFEVEDGGLCGLRKVGRPGGFAHVDVYFEESTPQQKRREFISFVEDHLARNGVEIREQLLVTCPRGYVIDEETIRIRIAEGDKHVLCPRCNTSHSLTEGAAEAREHDLQLAERLFALRTEIEERRDKVTEDVVHALGRIKEAAPSAAPIRVLHLSDLHFTVDTPVKARLQWLLDDLKQEGGLGIKELDYLVISGDFTDKGLVGGFEKAYKFVSELTQAFGLSAERCIFVPGNHDVQDLDEAYDWRSKVDGLKQEEWVRQGDVYLVRNPDKYPLRLKPFSDSFFHKFVQRAYPLEDDAQGFAIPFWDTGIQFVTLNSCYQIDQFYRKRSGIHPEAVAHAIKQAQEQEADARQRGQLVGGAPLLRIAVWHHAVIGVGKEQMENTDFLENLQKGGVKLALHGDVHEMVRNQVGYRHDKGIHVVGSGSFGAVAKDRPEAMPRLYNVLEIARDLKSLRVHTRCQPKADGTWEGWYQWPDPEGGKGRVAYYDVPLSDA